MSDEDFFALFGEDEAQALRLSSVGIVVTGEGRHRGRNGDDVFPEIPTADAALGAHAAVRTIRHGDALERFLKICLEPRLRDTRVDVIPRKRRVQSRVGGDTSIDASLAAQPTPSTAICGGKFRLKVRRRRTSGNEPLWRAFK